MIKASIRWLLAVFYFAAGMIHLINPAPFLVITPAWVPAPEAVVLLTGVAEILGAIGLAQPFSPRLRQMAGWGLALYALCVWPANINHAVNDIAVGGRTLPLAYHAPRLLLQPVIIWWALWVGGVTDWPFRRKNTLQS